jgi:hypothetical protein
MVMIVPVAVVMPAMVMFIPPNLALSPAPLASFVQFMTPMARLPAVIAMVLYGFMKFVFSMRGPPVASVVGRGSRRQEQQTRSQYGQGQQLSYE